MAGRFVITAAASLLGVGILTAVSALSTATPAATPVVCPANTVVTMPVPTPSLPGAYSYDSGQFDFVASADGTIVVHADQRYGVGSNKFGFNKPDGSISSVTGRRIGGDAPPMGVDQFSPESYPLNFEVMGIKFPVAGCWEITISAESSKLRFYATVTDAVVVASPSCGPCDRPIESESADSGRGAR